MIEKERIKLRESMTLEEKILQLLQLMGVYFEEEGMITGPQNSLNLQEGQQYMAGTVLGLNGAKTLGKVQKDYLASSRLKIPLLFMMDIINGYKTILPIPLAQGASFDPDLTKEGAAMSAKESAVSGLHVTFSPMVDLVRDSRWGRVMESTGEDPYLNACFAKSMIEGYQGNTSDGKIGPYKLGACFKHFAAYGAPEAGREYNNVELSERTLFEDYLPSYEAAVKAGSKMAMASFNTWNRIPMSANKYLLRDILRGKMKFKGVLISDWAALDELKMHGVAENNMDAASLGLVAGVDIDMMSRVYLEGIQKLLFQGKITENLLDEAVDRILALKNDLGLFENPYKDLNEEEEASIILCQEHRNLARKMAEDSMVLLKNEGLLPIDLKKEKIAFIGPYSKNRQMMGSWSLLGQEKDVETIEEVVNKEEPLSAVFEEGAPILSTLKRLIIPSQEEDRLKDQIANKEQWLEKAKASARGAEKIVLLLGEYYLESGEAASKTRLDLDIDQKRLFDEVYKINKNIVVVLFSGRPLCIEEIAQKAKGVIEAWMPGTKGAQALVNLLLGRVNFSAKLPMSFPRNVGQLPMSYNSLRTGRPNEDGQKNRFLSKYIDEKNEPLYAFGYGQSYTSFKFSKVELNRQTIRQGLSETIEALIEVENTGKYPGSEVLQLYIQDIIADVARPNRQLKGFKKVYLEVGEKKTVAFTISESMLTFYDQSMIKTSQKGKFNIWIGNSSETDNMTCFELI